MTLAERIREVVPHVRGVLAQQDLRLGADRLEEAEAQLVAYAAAVVAVGTAFRKAGVVFSTDKLTWMFREDPRVEVSASGGTHESRVEWLLMEVRFLIDDLLRRHAMELSAVKPVVADIKEQYDRRVAMYVEAGGDAEKMTRAGNLTCYLPYEMLRKLFEGV